MSPTRVQIYGQTYSIAGDLDPAYVQKLAAYVDEKMRAISDATTTVDTQKAAVLAALAIADELHSGLHERTEQEEANKYVKIMWEKKKIGKIYSLYYLVYVNHI